MCVCTYVYCVHVAGIIKLYKFLQKATDEELCKIKGHLQGNSTQPLDKPEM